MVLDKYRLGRENKEQDLLWDFAYYQKAPRVNKASLYAGRHETLQKFELLYICNPDM